MNEFPTTDEAFLRGMGMGPDERPELWRLRQQEYPDGTGYWEEDWCDCPPLGLDSPATTPEDADRYLANSIVVFRPEMRRRGLLLILKWDAVEIWSGASLKPVAHVRVHLHQYTAFLHALWQAAQAST